MPRASSTPAGGSTPAGWIGKRQIGEAAARRRIAPLIEGFERLIAMGCQPPAGSMVHIMRNYLRDLAPVRTIDPSIVASAVGATRRGRSPVTVTLLLNARSFASVERHLCRATPEEDAEVESLASHALDLQTAKRHAAAVKADAYAHREGLSRSLSLLSRAPHTPARRHRAAVVAEFHAEASRAYSTAEVASTKAGNALRRHLGQPLARPGHANQSRHRVARGRKRYARWWNARRGQQKPAHGAPTGLGLRFSEIGESARFYFAGAAAYTFGPVLAFTLNLDGERSARALKSGRPAGWLLDRVRKELRAKLGRDVPVALAIELNAAGLVHAHGFLAGCTMAEASPITGAMCRAGGSTYRGTDQLDLKPSPDSGWASYGVKDALKTVQAFGDAHRVAISADLNTAAAAVYAEVVAFVTHPGKQQPPVSKDKSALTSVPTEHHNVKILNKAHCVRRLTELPLDCGQQREVDECTESKLLLTDLPTYMKEWRFERAPTLDSC